MSRDDTSAGHHRYEVAPSVGHVDGAALVPVGGPETEAEEPMGTEEPVSYVATLPDGPPLVLRGSAAVIWQAAVPGGTRDVIVERVTTATGLSAEDVASDVTTFLDDLVERGLLVRAPEGGDVAGRR